MCALRCYRLVMPCPPAAQSPFNATPSPESTGAITTTRARELLDPPPRAACARPSGRPTPAPPAPKGVPSIRSIRSSASDHHAFQLAHQLLACVCLGRVCARHASSSLGGLARKPGRAVARAPDKGTAHLNDLQQRACLMPDWGVCGTQLRQRRRGAARQGKKERKMESFLACRPRGHSTRTILHTQSRKIFVIDLQGLMCSLIFAAPCTKKQLQPRAPCTVHRQHLIIIIIIISRFSSGPVQILLRLAGGREDGHQKRHGHPARRQPCSNFPSVGGRQQHRRTARMSGDCLRLRRTNRPSQRASRPRLMAEKWTAACRNVRPLRRAQPAPAARGHVRVKVLSYSTSSLSSALGRERPLAHNG